jgi:hypothetical protein
MTFWEKSREMHVLVLLLSLRERLIGIWNDYKNGKVFVSLDFISDTPFIFSMSLEDSRPNIMMMKALKKYKFWRNFLDNFSLRYCLF